MKLVVEFGTDDERLSRVATLADYYRDLLTWEEEAFVSLIDFWPVELAREVGEDFQVAVASSGIKGAPCPLRPGSSNQSIGNQVEEFTVSRLAPRTMKFKILPCSGAGYPDKTLVQTGSGLKIAFEIKATSDWNPSDSNRRVLTSSSEKIRRTFKPPVHHLLCTLLYTVQDGSARIDAMRLDFIEPTTSVNVRLEASVNHKILASGPHKSIVI